jgi:hypothetical protein
MVGESIAFMENHQISAHCQSTCGQNLNSAATSQRLHLLTDLGIRDATNHRIRHNHQIRQDTRLILENRAVRVLILVFPPNDNKISGEGQPRRSANSPKLSVFRRFPTWRHRRGSASKRASKHQCDLPATIGAKLALTLTGSGGSKASRTLYTSAGKTPMFARIGKSGRNRVRTLTYYDLQNRAFCD